MWYISYIILRMFVYMWVCTDMENVITCIDMAYFYILMGFTGHFYVLFFVIIRYHYNILTHWGRVTHICVANLTIIGPDNGLSPGRCQVIICTNAGILLIGPLGTNFSEIQIGIQTVLCKKMHLKMASVKWCPFCLGLNVLTPSISPMQSFVVIKILRPIWQYRFP